MAEAENKDLVGRYMAEVWNEVNPADPAVLGRFLSPSFRRHVSPLVPPLDLDGQIERLAGIRSAFPDITIRPDKIIAEGDLVVAQATMRGTHQGEFAGIPPTGKEITVSIVDVIRVEDDQFAEQWGGPDVFDLLRQLGATVAAGD